MDMKLYIVYTKLGSEKKVSEIFTRKRIENYSPVNSVSKDSSNNRKVKETFLFKGYVFVKSTIEQHQDLKKVRGVLNFVYWMGKPVSIKNREIKLIRLFLSEYENVNVEKIAIIPDSISKVDSYNVEQEVPLIKIKNKKAYVRLPSLGYVMTADVETPNVRVISSKDTFDNENLKLNKLFYRVFDLNNSLKNYLVKAFIISICVFFIYK